MQSRLEPVCFVILVVVDIQHLSETYGDFHLVRRRERERKREIAREGERERDIDKLVERSAITAYKRAENDSFFTDAVTRTVARAIGHVILFKIT